MGSFPAFFHTEQSLIPNFHHLYPEYRLLFQHFIPCPNFPESRFPCGGQIPDPVEKILRFPESHTVFRSNPESREYPSCILNPAPRDGSKLERNEKYSNFYCSSSITLVFPLFNPVLCGDPIFQVSFPNLPHIQARLQSGLRRAWRDF